MKNVSLILLLILLNFASTAQKQTSPYAAIDKKALEIPVSQTRTTKNIANYIENNFTTEKDKVRAAFTWAIHNIDYDISNMFTLNFYEKKDDRIAKALATHQGVCIHYADVFTDICSQMGLTSYVVTGYTRQNGYTDYIPHAWSAILVDNKWQLFDPTWAAGNVTNDKFIRKVNEQYYMPQPDKLIASHMPFDCIWQCLNYPVSYQDFNMGNPKQNTSKPYFRYADTIANYLKLDEIGQKEATARRIELNGKMNSMVFDHLHHIKLEIENHKQNKTINLYNAAAAAYNKSINQFNDYIAYYNKQFSPAKKDPEIQEMMDAVVNNLSTAKTNLQQITKADENLQAMIAELLKSIDDISVKVDEQQEWLKKYFSKGKLVRKTMFYKYTFMGVPVN